MDVTTDFINPVDSKVCRLLIATRAQANASHVTLVTAPSHKRKKALQTMLKQTGAMCYLMEQINTWTCDDATLSSMMLEWTEDVQRCIELYNFADFLQGWPPVVEAWRRAARYYETRNVEHKPQDLTTLFT